MNLNFLRRNIIFIFVIILFTLIDITLFYGSTPLGDDASLSLSSELYVNTERVFSSLHKTNGVPLFLIKTEDNFIPLMHQDRQGGIPFALVKFFTLIFSPAVSLWLFLYLCKLGSLIIVYNSTFIKNKKTVILSFVLTPIFYFHYTPLIAEVVMLPSSILLLELLYRYRSSRNHILAVSFIAGLCCVIIKATFIWYLFLIFFVLYSELEKRWKEVLLGLFLGFIPLLLMTLYTGNIERYSPSINYNISSSLEALSIQLRNIYIYLFRGYHYSVDFLNSGIEKLINIEKYLSILFIVPIASLFISNRKLFLRFCCVSLILFLMIRFMILDKGDDLYHYLPIALFGYILISSKFLNIIFSKKKFILNLLCLSFFSYQLVFTIGTKLMYGIHNNINSSTLLDVIKFSKKQNIDHISVFTPYLGRLNFLSSGDISENSYFYVFTDRYSSFSELIDKERPESLLIYETRPYHRSRVFILDEMINEEKDIGKEKLKKMLTKYKDYNQKLFSAEYNFISFIYTTKK